LPKGDSIHLYIITNSCTSVLSKQIQEFGKGARAGKREVTNNFQHLCLKRKKEITGEIFCLLTFIAINTYSAFCYVLSGNKL
jgi:hypothetical protein